MTELADIKCAVSKRAAEYGAERVYLFGSYARGSDDEQSDVDLRIDRGTMKGFALGGLLLDLEKDLGTKVDIVTTGSLSADFLKGIESEEELIYEAQ